MKPEPLLIINPKIKKVLKRYYPHLNRYLKMPGFSDTELLLLNKYSTLESKRADAERGLYNTEFEKEEEDLFNDIEKYMKNHKIKF